MNLKVWIILFQAAATYAGIGAGIAGVLPFMLFQPARERAELLNEIQLDELASEQLARRASKILRETVRKWSPRERLLVLSSIILGIFSILFYSIALIIQFQHPEL